MKFQDDSLEKLNEKPSIYSQSEIDKLFGKLFTIVGLDILLFILVGFVS